MIRGIFLNYGILEGPGSFGVFVPGQSVVAVYLRVLTGDWK